MAKKKEVKFTDEELGKINEVQQKYSQIQANLGQIAFQRVMVEQQIEQLGDQQLEAEDALQANQESERELARSLNDVYGPGSLDPVSGVFTPTEEPSE
jgi:chromosome segregation ATPase